MILWDANAHSSHEGSVRTKEPTSQPDTLATVLCPGNMDIKQPSHVLEESTASLPLETCASNNHISSTQRVLLDTGPAAFSPPQMCNNPELEEEPE